MGIPVEGLLPWAIYGGGLLLLALSMIWDVYLSFIPHLAVAVGAGLALGLSWPAAAAFIIPHLLFLGVKALLLSRSPDQ